MRRTITDIFERNHRCYGYLRLQASLNRQGVNISEKVVQRLMKQECLVVATPKRCRYGSNLGEVSPAPENLLNRDFRAAASNAKWLTDITEFQLPAGKVHLSPMIDCFDGMVVSGSIGACPDAELVNSCWMPPSRRSQPVATGLLCTLTAAPAIAGLDGYSALPKRS